MQTLKDLFSRFMVGAIISAIVSVSYIWFVVEKSLDGYEVSLAANANATLQLRDEINRSTKHLRDEIGSNRELFHSLDKKLIAIEAQLDKGFNGLTETFQKGSLEPSSQKDGSKLGFASVPSSAKKRFTTASEGRVFDWPWSVMDKNCPDEQPFFVAITGPDGKVRKGCILRANIPDLPFALQEDDGSVLEAQGPDVPPPPGG